MSNQSVYLIEPQSLFVPALLEVFDEAGLQLRGVSSDADARLLLDAQPDILFIDIDYMQQEPGRLIELLGSLLPRSSICVYTGIAHWLKDRLPCNTRVLSKHADRQQIVNGLRSCFLHSV